MNGLANGAYGILEEGAVNGLQAGLDNGLANGLVNSDNSQINWQNIGAENWEKYRKQLIKFNQPIINDTLFTSAVTVSALTNQFYNNGSLNNISILNNKKFTKIIKIRHKNGTFLCIIHNKNGTFLYEFTKYY